MKITDNLVEKNQFANTIIKKTVFQSKEELLEVAQKQKDCFEYAGIKKEYFCKQYNDLGKQLVKTGKVRLGIPSDTKKSMLDCLERYYEGKCSNEELEEKYIEYCKQIGVGEKTRLLDIYENFINMSRYAANNCCIKKGNEITVNYGSVDDHDAVYYNAEYYYNFEKVREIAREASNKIAELMDFEEVDYEARESNTIFDLDGEFNFNGKWGWNAQNMINRCTMKSIDVIPPEGFEFYFKERTNENDEVGVMLVGIEEGYKEVTVPFETPKAGVTELVQKFNAAELCEISEGDTDNYERYNEFLKNFDIYTRYYYANLMER